MEVMKHFSHEHPLILRDLRLRELNDDDDDDDNDDDARRYKCDGCLELIFLLGPNYYSCIECNYNLHKICAEQPRIIQHPMHSNHPLTLLDKPRRAWNSPYKCNCCEKVCRSFHYTCVICNFDLDIVCATWRERKINHPSHEHPLTPMFNPMLSMCSACGKEHQGFFYQCSSTCLWFWIHRDCASLPTKLFIKETTKDHHHQAHPLTLAFSLSYHHAKFFPKCGLCEKKLDRYYWLYKCEGCRYFVHLDCATAKMEPFMSILLPPGRGNENEEEEEYDDPSVIQLPYQDESHNLIRNNLSMQSLEKRIGNERETTMLDEAIHQHTLVLFDGESSSDNHELACDAYYPRVKKFSLHRRKQINLLCNACMQPITTASFYKCVKDQCSKFFLHEWCVQLPTKIERDMLHQHPLSLTKPPGVFSSFRCKICGNWCNGFYFSCHECPYDIDIGCGLLPYTIRHKAHSGHRLILKETLLTEKCRACPRLNMKEGGYSCESCNFRLCSDCSQLPLTIRRKSYDEHPYKLAFHPVPDHLAEYFCDICEEELNPNEWFYHCSECDQSIHTKCGYPNINYGGILEIFKCHPHPLFLVKPRNISCSNCCGSIDNFDFAFKCMHCKFALDEYCAKSLIIKEYSTRDWVYGDWLTDYLDAWSFEH